MDEPGESRTSSDIDRVGQDAALLSAVEIGLGSVLHAFRVPLSGQFLSLNQLFMLSRSTLQSARAGAPARTVGFQISMIAALLKSLAPAGKKLTPMLAIAAQGLLLSIGTLAFGANLVGLLVGGTLLSLWSFAQPFLIYLLVFGSTLLEVIGYFADKLGEAFSITRDNWVAILATLIGVKIVAAWAVVILAYRLPETWVSRYQSRLLELRWKEAKPRTARNASSPAHGALGDLLSPLFVLSFALTAVFLVFVESSWSRAIWVGLRSLTVAFAVFYLIRWLPGRIQPRWLESGSLGTLGRSFSLAARRISQRD